MTEIALVDKTVVRTDERFSDNGARHVTVTTVHTKYEHRRGVRWTIGPVTEVRVPGTHIGGPQPVGRHIPRKADIEMNLVDNQSVTFSAVPEDSVGNPSGDTNAVVFSVDDPTVLTLVDNGDGSGSVTATGKLGPATLTANLQEPSPDGGTTPGADFIGAVAFIVVAGSTSQIAINVAAPTP